MVLGLSLGLSKQWVEGCKIDEATPILIRDFRDVLMSYLENASQVRYQNWNEIKKNSCCYIISSSWVRILHPFFHHINTLQYCQFNGCQVLISVFRVCEKTLGDNIENLNTWGRFKTKFCVFWNKKSELPHVITAITGILL